MKLKNKNVLITGGSRGIGKAIAMGFAKEGANVAFNYVTDEKKAKSTLDELEQFGTQCFSIQSDIGASEGRKNLFDQAINFMNGRIDVLINNAGVLTRTNFVDISEEELDKVVRVNLIAPFILTQMIAKNMCEKEIHGTIVNISSISALHASGNLSHYECSKAGLLMLTKSAALELAANKIRVNCILPGLTSTDINKNQWQDNPEVWEKRASGIPLGRTGTSNDYVGAAVFLASDESSWMTGASLTIDGGVSCK